MKNLIEEFSKYIINEELNLNWKMDWGIDGECIKELKVIIIPYRECIDSLWSAKEYIIHEIAHALCNDIKHGDSFYNIYLRLLEKYHHKE